MSKISLTLYEYMSEASRLLLLGATDGASKALAQLGSCLIGTSAIEVIRIGLTTWFPHDQLWVRMVLNNNGKKEEVSLIQNPSVANVSELVELWAYSTLHKQFITWHSDATTSSDRLLNKMGHLNHILNKKETLLLAGTKVKTTKENPNLRNEWSPEALLNRKWGVSGVIVTHHDSHGLCYEVRHEDGTIGSYDPTEIEVVN